MRGGVKAVWCGWREGFVIAIAVGRTDGALLGCCG